MALVETSLVEGVMTVTLADVDNRNTLSAGLTVELVEVLDAADADPDVRVVVLTNRGRVFCAGADLSERSSDDAPSRVVSPLELFGRFRNSPKPYVGRIAGHCVAGGMGLAAAMDISVATDEARFGFTEVRIGVAPAMISVICLPKMPTRCSCVAAASRPQGQSSWGSSTVPFRPPTSIQPSTKWSQTC